MIKLEIIKHKTTFDSWDFNSEADFIAHTIQEAINNVGSGDEYEALSSYGFTEVIDKKVLDEDGDILEIESHWEGDYQACLNYWKYASTIYEGNAYSYWKVTEK